MTATVWDTIAYSLSLTALDHFSHILAMGTEKPCRKVGKKGDRQF